MKRDRAALADTTFYLPGTSFGNKRQVFFNVFLLSFLLHRYDYLRITDGSGNSIGTYCGYQTGKRVRIVGTVAILIFHTDASVQRLGFELSFSTFRQSPSEFRSVSTVFSALIYFCYCTQRISTGSCFLLQEPMHRKEHKASMY